MLQAFLKRALTFLDIPRREAAAYRKGQQEERARCVRILRDRADYLDRSIRTSVAGNTAPALRDLADKIEGD